METIVRPTNDAAMDVTLGCRCGGEISGSEPLADHQLDLRVLCEQCGRRYVVTVTQFSDPADGR